MKKRQLQALALSLRTLKRRNGRKMDVLLGKGIERGLEEGLKGEQP